MKNALKLELRKALKNKYFFLSLLMGSALAIASAVIRIQQYDHDLDCARRIRSFGVMYNSMPEAYTLYNEWLGADGYTIAFSLFFFLFPLFATIPYAWNYCLERNQKYEHNLVIRTGKAPYYTSKYLAAFFSGGLAVVLPLLLNFLIIAMVIPARQPTIQYEMYYGVDYGNMYPGFSIQTPCFTTRFT